MRLPSRLRVLQVLLLLFVAATTLILVDGCDAFGRAAQGDRKLRMEQSPQWQDGHFVNPQPLQNDVGLTLKGLFHVDPHASPDPPLQVKPIDPQRFLTPPPSGLRVTWLGHSTTLLEVDGRRVLTDPQWSERASPLTWLGPKRWYPPPIALADLPPIDAVVISHDHYDHLDMQTIVAMKEWKNTQFFVPLGVGAHLEHWGIPSRQITELDWWGEAQIADLRIVCTPARHASGRTGLDKDATLWAGWALIGPQHRVYFSGDTGLFRAMREIGQKLGPFDLTLIEVGQYHEAWPDWHIGPEQAVEAHQRVQGRVLLPIHWALFQLAYHGWTEPGERVAAESARKTVEILTPQPGESVEPTLHPRTAHWWPQLPWHTGAENPIVSHDAE